MQKGVKIFSVFESQYFRDGSILRRQQSSSGVFSASLTQARMLASLFVQCRVSPFLSAPAGVHRFSSLNCMEFARSEVQ